MDEHGGVPANRTRGGLVGGLILVMLGIGLLVIQFTSFDASIIVLFLGIAFLVGAIATRAYGLVVPGCILSGLGVGLFLEQLVGQGALQLQEPVAIGLGLGFIAIWVFDQFFTRTVPREGRWWPLIPGGILLAVGIVNNLGGFDVYGPYLFAAALIIVGVVIVVRALTGRGAHTS